MRRRLRRIARIPRSGAWPLVFALYLPILIGFRFVGVLSEKAGLASRNKATVIAILGGLVPWTVPILILPIIRLGKVTWDELELDKDQEPHPHPPSH